MQDRAATKVVVPKKYRGVSQVYGQKAGHQQEFQDRFKGRATLINKEGHQGVVSTVQKPIDKGSLSQRDAVLGRTPESKQVLQQYLGTPD